MNRTLEKPPNEDVKPPDSNVLAKTGDNDVGLTAFKDENHRTSELIASKPSRGLINQIEGAGEVFYDYNALQYSPEGLTEKDNISKWNKALKKNSESEISGSESDSDSSKTLFMKSDSDTSMETVVDRQIELDTDNDYECLNTENSDNVTMEVNSVVQETASQDRSEDSSTSKEGSSLFNEALEIKTDCDSGFSSQVDMTQFTADVMTLRREITLCDRKGTVPGSSTKQIYFNTNEGSVITFECSMQNEITANFDKFNNTCIDLVKKDCPSKMLQLVYQAGLKALNSNNLKHLCCVFMLDNDYGQIDKLFESKSGKISEVVVFESNPVENQGIEGNCSRNSNVMIPINESPDILNKAIIKLLPEIQIKELANNDIISGSWNSTEHLEYANLDYASFSSELDVRAKDLANDMIQATTSPQTETRKNIFSNDKIELMKKELDSFFKNKAKEDVIEKIKDTNIKKYLQSKDENSNLNGISPENIDKNYMAGKIIQENKKKADDFIEKPQNIDNESFKEDKVVQKILEPSQNEDTLKTNTVYSKLNEPAHKNIEKTSQGTVLNTKYMNIKNFNKKSAKNTELNMNKDKFKTAILNKKYPIVEVIEDFSKLKIGSVEACCSKKSKNIPIQPCVEIKKTDLVPNVQSAKKEETNKNLENTPRTRARSLESQKVAESTIQEKSTQLTEISQKEVVSLKIPKWEELHQQITSFSEYKESLKVIPSDEKKSKAVYKKKSVNEDSSTSKGNKLLEKAMTEKFHTVNHVLHVCENTLITKTRVTGDTKYQDIPVSNSVNEISKTESTSELVEPVLKAKNDIATKISDISVKNTISTQQNEKQRLSSESLQNSVTLEEKENPLVIVSSVPDSPKEQRKRRLRTKPETVAISLEEKESSVMIISSVPEYIPKTSEQERDLSKPETVNKSMPDGTTSKESVTTNKLNVPKNAPNLLGQKKYSFTEIGVTEKLPVTLPEQKIQQGRRSSSCSRITEKLEVTFLSKTECKYEGSIETCSEKSEESTSVEEVKPQFVRSAIHLLNSVDPPYTPYKIVWIKSIIKSIDKIGILECNVDIPPKMKPKPVENTTDTNIRPIIPRSNTQLGGLVADCMQSSPSTSSAISENSKGPQSPVKIWQAPTRDEHGFVSRPIKTYKLNANAEEYVPNTENYKPDAANIETSPDIYLEFQPDIIKRPYRAISPYDNPVNIRYLPKQQIPFFPRGVYVAHNGNVRLNLRSFISIDITVDLGIRVTYPFSRIFLALSHNGKHAAMVHPYGRVYQYYDTIEANIYDGYTGACKLAKLTEKEAYFSNDVTNKVYLVDKFGTHRNRSTTFFHLKEDFTSVILTQTGRHGAQYSDEAVSMLSGAKFETCGFNHIIIIKNIKIIQYPTGNLSIFRYDRRDHIQICPNEGHCKISTPNVHITGTLNITDNKPHIFIRKDDKRISFSPERFFVRTEGQTAGYNANNEVFIDYPI